MKDYLTNAEELRSILDIKDSTEYFDFKAYTDSKVGFSIKRAYPENISYKPPKKDDGRPDVVALLHVYYTHPSETSQEIDTNAVPIQIDIMPYSYCNHSYDFTNPECPTRESIDISNKTREPIALRRKYLYNHESNIFIRSHDGKQLRGKKVLDYLFQEHCDTVHLCKGMIMRLRVFTQKTIFSFLSVSVKFIIWLIKILYGRTIYKGSIVGDLKGYKKEDFRRNEANTVTFLNISTSKNVVITFSIMFIITTILIYIFGSNVVKEYSFSNAFIISVWALLFLFIVDPSYVLLLWLLNKFIKLRTKAMLVSL